MSECVDARCAEERSEPSQRARRLAIPSGSRVGTGAVWLAVGWVSEEFVKVAP